MPTSIYKITNKVNSDFYIGKTSIGLTRRFKKHFYNHKGGQTYLYKAMRKYGFENFIIEELERVTSDILDERERYWIATLNPTYNLTEGGTGGDTSASPNYISGMKKRRSYKGENNPRYGKPFKHSEETKAKMRRPHVKLWCPVMCEGVRYESVGAAEAAYPGIKVRYRLNSKNWPEFIRLRPKTLRK